MKPTILDRAVNDLRVSVMNGVRQNHQECQLFINHVQAFLASIEEEGDHPQDLLDELQGLSETLVDLNRILVDINDRPQLKSILWKGDISDFISRAYKQFSSAGSVKIYQSAQLLFQRFKIENENARKIDASDFHDIIQDVRDEKQILAILGVPKVQFPQAMMAILQHIKKLEDNCDLERRFLDGGLHAMQAMSCTPSCSLDGFMITPFDIVIHRDRILGEGGSSKVFEGHWRGSKVAIKLLLKVPQALVENEIKVLKKLQHDNILQIFGVCQNPGEPFFVSALKSSGDVNTFLSWNPDADRRKLCHEASAGLLYLHENSVIHGDLKPPNVLVDENGVACLCDFGLSRIRTYQTVLPTVPSSNEPPVAGTIKYMSPEQMMYGIINEKTDIYSFGMTVYGIFSGDFQDVNSWSSLRNDVVNCGNRPPKPQNFERGFSEGLWNLIQDCWLQYPADRPTAATVVSRLDALRNCGVQILEKDSSKPLNAHSSESLNTIVQQPETIYSPQEGVGQSGKDPSLQDKEEEAPDLQTKYEGVGCLPSLSGNPSPSRGPESPISRHGGEDRLITQQDIIIALLGPSGTGKSSFINAATGTVSALIGHDLDSCTQDVQAISCLHPDGSGRTVVFVDTPGFDDSSRRDCDILREIAKWLKTTYKQKITLTGILLFHSIGESRMHGTPLRNLEMFRELCGEDALRNVILTTTMWDDVPEETGLRRENQLRTTFWGAMMSHGCRIARFSFTHKSAWEIINQFDFHSRRPIQLQTELVDEGKELSQTRAYSVLLRWWELLVSSLKGKLRRRVRFKDPGAKEKQATMSQRLAIAVNQKRRLERVEADSFH